VIVRYRVAGLTLAVQSPRPWSALALPPELRAFACDRGADIRLHCTDEPVPEPAGAPLFDSGGVWRVDRHHRDLLYTFRTENLDPPVYKAVRIDRTLSEGTVYFPRPRRGRAPRFVLEHPLDELLFQHRFARERAMEVHACAVVVEGRAVLFCGVSGAGKSTTARLWQRHRPGTPTLSDDRIVLRARGGRWMAHGTPWHGDAGFALPRAVPLGALFFLEQAPRTEVRVLARPQAAARLFARSFPPLWDRAGVGAVLAASEEATARVPCYELRFRPDRSAVAAVLDTLGACPQEGA
jgi:hypothetical protein